MKKNKPIVAMDLSSTGKGGGPFVSTSRIMNSGLKDKYDFRAIHYRTGLGRGISIKRIKDIVKQLKTVNPDIVHFTGLQLSGFHMAVACRIAKVKNTIITVRGFSGDAIYYNWLKKSIVSYVIEPLSLVMVKVIYANSEYTRNRNLIKLFRHKTLGSIYNFPPQPHMGDSMIREELNLNKEDVIVVSVARINKDKGYHILAESILHFKGKSGLKFIIVGDGDYLPEMELKLQKQINSKQVFFLGYRNDIQKIIKDCNVFVLPTLHETLSIALLEASVEGLALIASNTGGVPEIVESNHNGFLVEPSNVADLVKSIEILSTNEKLREKFAENAKKKIHNKFSIKDIENKIDKIYQDLLNNK